MSRLSVLSTLVLLLLLFFYACETEQLLPEGELETTPATEDLRGATLAQVDVTLKDGALAFPDARELSRAIYAVNNATTTELDAWAAALGFESWGREYREIQDRLAANTEVHPRNLLTAEEQPRYLIEDDGYVRTAATTKLYGELLSKDGILYVNGDINYFSRTYHIMIDEGTPEAVRQVLAKPVPDPEAGIYVEELSNGLRWTEEKESKYFSCPNASFNNYGHRKEENISGNKQRLIVEWYQFYNTVSVVPGTVDYFFFMGLDILNQRKSGFQWIGTQPDFEAGTLENNVSSGEVSSTDVERALSVRRRISFGGVVADEYFGPPTAGAGIFEDFSGVSSAILIVDAGNTRIVPNQQFFPNVLYALENGKVSVNWLERSTTMDIQLGCQ